MDWIRGDEIGHGGFASISLAIPNRKLSPGLPQIMAVKSCDLSDSATLMNEHEVLLQLGDCPQLIRFFGAGRTVERGGSELYNLLLEYAPGGSLVDEMGRCGGRLPEPDVRRYTRSVLEALRHIHGRGFVHGDIKVQNILVFPPADGGCGLAEVKVADFGLSRRKTDLVATAAAEDDGGRGGFEWRGTPLYMSPEAVNENECEAPSDVWALGCAVVEMATGRPAWSHTASSNIYQLMIRIGVSHQTPIIPQDLSDEGKDFLHKCFVKDPKMRWTVEMLLSHPFIAVSEVTCVDALPPPPSQSQSPNSHFDFMVWDSLGPSSSTAASEREFRTEKTDSGLSLTERILCLATAGDMIPSWEEWESESWGWSFVR
ncbi:hypothetical protein SAY86_024710 [Trapa natans]|uniref:Protein kinase domain-containing protein n=1 Tax=Trapa natans TaxID=22666 RepID=A0AAN7MPU7_TRANT|nr:hypothetical protein SAY86_024710 [Trapa natans]